MIHRREEASNRVMESTLNPSTSTVNPSEAEYPPLPSHHRKNVSLLENWPEFNMTQLNKSILEFKTEFANKLSETLNLLQDIELGNSTLDQTINEMTEYVNNIVDEINESFNMLVTAFKQRLDRQVELVAQHAQDLILEAKRTAQEELTELQSRVEAI